MNRSETRDDTIVLLGKGEPLDSSETIDDTIVFLLVMLSLDFVSNFVGTDVVEFVL